jgi:poly-gamma-glutamate capsule biosynthesis protein CapA/YwtB (metallophosphatase superfamily)
MLTTILGMGDVVISGELQRGPGRGTIFDHLQAADACFANLEMPFCSKDEIAAEKLITIRCDPAHGHNIRDMGIDVVTLANNHAMDYGLPGLKATIQTIEQCEVAHVGGGMNTSEAFAPVYKTLNGLRVAFIGATTTLPNGSGAGDSRPGLAGVRVFSKFVVDTVTIDESPGMAPYVETATYKPDEETLLSAIRNAKVQADVVLVGIHWGVPFGWAANTQDELAAYQRPLAHAMIAAGASAIFGHHPHVVQGVEVFEGAPIFYSLGNFIFSNDVVTPGDGWRTYPPYSFKSLQQTLSNIGALARVGFRADGKLAQCSLIPVTISENGEPLGATRQDAETLLARLRALSTDKHAAFKLDEAANGHSISMTSLTA